MTVIINGTSGVTFPNGVTMSDGTSAPVTVAQGGTGSTSLSTITVGTATNLAGGGAGQVPYQSASGTTAMLAAGTSGQVLQSNGASAPSWVNVSAGLPGVLGQVFTSNGTFTIPSGVTAIKVTVVGGGGGGGGYRTGGQICGQSGSGGGAAIKYLTSLTPGNTLSVTVGAAGAGNKGDQENGGSGGTSSVASGTQTITTISATGGGGGGYEPSGTTSGGIGSNGDMNIKGTQGFYGVINANSIGGSSIFGGGGMGAISIGGYGGTSAAAGGAYGGGGGGGTYAICGFAAKNSAAGAAGVVIIEW